GVADGADALGHAVEVASVLLEPAGGVVHVGDGLRVAAVLALAEVDGDHDDAAAGHRLVERLVLEPVVVVPGAAVDLHQDRERAGALRLVDARQPGAVAVTAVLDVAALDFERAGRVVDVPETRKRAGTGG